MLNPQLLLTVAATAMMILHSVAQDKVSRAPPQVIYAFAKQFPAGHVKKWMQKDQEYIGTFRQSGKKCFAYFNAAGFWEKTESPVKWTRNLPSPVRISWNNCKYRDWLIMDMKKIVKPSQTFYTIHVGRVQSLGPDDADIGSEYILFFSEPGELVKEERQP